MKILHLRFSEIWPGKGKRYGRTDGRTDIHGTKTYICLPQGETYNYEVAFWDLKNSYFFDISLNIDRSDMKQTAKNSVRSMLSYPFTFVGILTHTFFFWCYHFSFFFYVTIVFDFITHRFVVAHTPRSIHQATFTRCVRGFKCPYTCLFLYRKKLQMSTFWYTYIRKNPFELLEVHTRPYTIICSGPPHIMCHVLSFQ